MEIKKILLVFITVSITLLTAILLNLGAKEGSLLSISAIVIIFIVIFGNYIKFKIWGYIHKKYHLNESYPIVALFFPLIYIVAIYNNESDFEIKKAIGILFIIIGIVVINKRKEIL